MRLGAGNIMLVALRESRHRFFFFLSLAAGDGVGSSGFCEKYSYLGWFNARVYSLGFLSAHWK